MKKLLVLALALISLPLLAACENMGDAESYKANEEAKKSTEAPASKESTATTNLWTSDDPFWGDANAPISMVVFSDFQCPYCGNFFQSLENLKTDWIDSGKLKIQYRDFPLAMHLNSLPAHLAANAALKQNKYLEMHRSLFEHQKDWEKSAQPQTAFEEYAQEWKLDLTQFRQDLRDPALIREMQEDKTAGQAAGISATPGFVLNGVTYEGAMPYDQLVQLLQTLQ